MGKTITRHLSFFLLSVHVQFAHVQLVVLIKQKTSQR